MKKCCAFVFLPLFMLCVVSASAKVWRVNNNAGVSRDFAELSTAAASALVQNGDTIYLEGSASNYVSATISKRLVIIGTGYLLSQNTGLQYNPNNANCQAIILDSLASGTKLEGIETNVVYTNSNTDNITITRCYLQIFPNTSFANSRMSNWVINKCFFFGQINLASASYVFENLQLTNCVMVGTVTISGTMINGLVRNNIFQSVTVLNNSYVSNNIFIGGSGVTLTNCAIRYNISQFNNLPADNGNQNNVAQANLFTLTGSPDARYQLKAGSPAIGAGEPVNGVTPDCGVFGTADPYRLSGIPPIPTIYALTVPASVPASATTMTITLSTRSNN